MKKRRQNLRLGLLLFSLPLPLSAPAVIMRARTLERTRVSRNGTDPAAVLHGRSGAHLARALFSRQVR